VSATSPQDKTRVWCSRVSLERLSCTRSLLSMLPASPHVHGVHGSEDRRWVHLIVPLHFPLHIHSAFRLPTICPCGLRWSQNRSCPIGVCVLGPVFGQKVLFRDCPSFSPPSPRFWPVRIYAHGRKPVFPLVQLVGGNSRVFVEPRTCSCSSFSSFLLFFFLIEFNGLALPSVPVFFLVGLDHRIACLYVGFKALTLGYSMKNEKKSTGIICRAGED